MFQDSAQVDRAIVDPKTYSSEAASEALFRGLRQHAPVRWCEPEGYRPFWLVSKHADIIEIERQSSKFINAPRAILRPREVEDRLAAAQSGNSNLLRSMNNMDGVAS